MNVEERREEKTLPLFSVDGPGEKVCLLTDNHIGSSCDGTGQLLLSLPLAPSLSHFIICFPSIWWSHY